MLAIEAARLEELALRAARAAVDVRRSVVDILKFDQIFEVWYCLNS